MTLQSPIDVYCYTNNRPIDKSRNKSELLKTSIVLIFSLVIILTELVDLANMQIFMQESPSEDKFHHYHGLHDDNLRDNLPIRQTRDSQEKFISQANKLNDPHHEHNANSDLIGALRQLNGNEPNRNAIFSQDYLDILASSLNLGQESHSSNPIKSSRSLARSSAFKHPDEERLTSKSSSPELPGANKSLETRFRILICLHTVYKRAQTLFEQHIDTLSQAMGERQADSLTESARAILSQLFTDNLKLFIEKHCLLNGAFIKQQDGVGPISDQVSMDAKAFAANMDKIVELLNQTFDSNFRVQGESNDTDVNWNLNLTLLDTRRCTNKKKLINGYDRTDSNDAAKTLETSASPTVVADKSDSNRHRFHDHDHHNNHNNHTSDDNFMVLIDKQATDIPNSFSIMKKISSHGKPFATTTTRTTNLQNDAFNSNNIRKIRVLPGLRPRSLMVKLNETMLIKYSEYMHDYAKRLLVFENQTNILIMVGASRYHLNGTYVYLFTWLLLVVILMGNCYILVSTRSCRRRRSNVNFFIVHLAIADLLVGIFSMCSDVLFRYLRDFTFGYPVCVMYKFLSVIFIFLSTYMLVALGFDRREAVVYPLNFARHRYRGTYLVSGAWLLSAILASPIVFLLRVVEVDGIRQCNIILTRTGWKIYVLYMLTFVILIPSILLIGFYSQIVSTINKKCRQAEILERNLKRQIEHHSQPKEAKNQTKHLEPGVIKAKDSASMVNSDSQTIESSSINDSQIRVTDSNIIEGHTTLTLTTMLPAESNCELINPIGVEESTMMDDVESSSDDEAHTQCNFIKALKCSNFPSRNITDVRTNLVADTTNKGRKNTINNGNIVRQDCNKVSVRKQHVNHKHGRKRSGSNILSSHKIVVSKVNDTHIQSMVNRQHGKSVIPKARLKTIQMTIAIVIAFLICWLPFYVVNIISVFDLIDQRNQFWDFVSSYTNIFCFLNSGMNPVLYFWFSHNHKKTKKQSSPTKNKTVLGANSSIRNVDDNSRQPNCKTSTETSSTNITSQLTKSKNNKLITFN